MFVFIRGYVRSGSQLCFLKFHSTFKLSSCLTKIWVLQETYLHLENSITIFSRRLDFWMSQHFLFQWTCLLFFQFDCSSTTKLNVWVNIIKNGHWFLDAELDMLNRPGVSWSGSLDFLRNPFRTDSFSSDLTPRPEPQWWRVHAIH